HAERLGRRCVARLDHQGAVTVEVAAHVDRSVVTHTRVDELWVRGCAVSASVRGGQAPRAQELQVRVVLRIVPQGLERGAYVRRGVVHGRIPFYGGTAVIQGDAEGFFPGHGIHR